LCIALGNVPRGAFSAALLVTIVFATGAFLLRGVAADGALAGSLVSLTFYITSGPQGFAILVLVFVLTALSSRIGASRKRELQLADPRTARSAGQVLANLWVAGIMLLLDCIVSQKVALAFSAAGFAALAEAAADTVASEIGEAFARSPRMILGFARVAPGTDGAISLPGTLAGLAAAALVAGATYALSMFSVELAIRIAIIGFLGMLLDSLLGALFQRRGLLTNGGVNLLATAASALAALLLLR
jgi:uncharacterized protein (TIGR00297 family)